MNISRLRGQILVKSVLDGVKLSLFKMMGARGPGRFYSSRTTRVKVRDDDALARENRCRSTGTDRERFKAASRRVSSESVCRDPARLGPGDSDRRIGERELIQMYIPLTPGACGHAIVHR